MSPTHEDHIPEDLDQLITLWAMVYDINNLDPEVEAGLEEYLQ